MLRRKEGATVEQIMVETGWQPHSLRGFTFAPKTPIRASSERGLRSGSVASPTLRGSLMRRVLLALFLTCATCLSGPAGLGTAEAQQFPDPSDALRISSRISEALLRQDIDGSVAQAAPFSLISPADLKNAFSKILNLNGGRYVDRVYSRLYGKSEADVIDKLKFTGSILFVRYLLHVDNGEWKIFDIEFKTESSEPFPKEWRHIYP